MFTSDASSGELINGVKPSRSDIDLSISVKGKKSAYLSRIVWLRTFPSFILPLTTFSTSNG